MAGAARAGRHGRAWMVACVVVLACALREAAALAIQKPKAELRAEDRTPFVKMQHPLGSEHLRNQSVAADEELELEGSGSWNVAKVTASTCQTNEVGFHAYGSDVSASGKIIAISGDDGRAVARCASPKCQAPALQFIMDDDKEHASYSAKEDANGGSHPSTVHQSMLTCERGSYRPSQEEVVRLAAHENFVAFGAGGCVELYQLDEGLVWMHLAALPLSLNMSSDDPSDKSGKKRSLLPQYYGSKVAMGEGVLAVTAAIDGPNGPIPSVIVYLGMSQSQWIWAYTLECHDPVCSCLGKDAAQCLGGFGSSLAVFDKLIAVGLPNNDTVLVYRQATSPGKPGIGLVWEFSMALTNKDPADNGKGLGASLSVDKHILVAGYPSGTNGGVKIFSMIDGAVSKTGDMIMDTKSQCCSLKLNCCSSGLVGKSVASIQQSDTVRVVVGDPENSQAILVDCSVRKLQFGSNKPTCMIVALIQPPADRGTDDVSHGFGYNVGISGDDFVVGDASVDCAGVDAQESCGGVCSIPSCPPGYCLLYDWSLSRHVCLGCGGDKECPGGIDSCPIEQIGIFAVTSLGSALIFVFCCCVCGMNAQLISVSLANCRECWDICLEICCCIPGRRQDGEENLLDGEGGGAQGEDNGQASEDDDNGEMKGYLPPEVKEALRLPLGGRNAEKKKAEQETAAKSRARDPEEADPDATTEQDEAEGEGANAGPGEQGDSEAAVEPSEPAEEKEGSKQDDDEEEKVGVSVDFFRCKGCMERAIETILIPCGHKTMCRRCAKGIVKCPIQSCKQKVERVQVIFHV